MGIRGILAGLAVASLVAIGGIEPASGQVMAGYNDDGSMARLPYQALGTMTSEPGESRDHFLARVGLALRAFSDRTKFEACAEIGAAPGGQAWGVVIGSTDSHLGCVVENDRVPVGMTPTGITIHSHGGGAGFRMSKADKILAGLDSVEHPIYINGEDLAHFSAQDFESGPGYLATPDGLRYQHGPGTAQAVPVAAH